MKSIDVTFAYTLKIMSESESDLRLDWKVKKNKPEKKRGFEVQISVQQRVDDVSSQPIQKAEASLS
jgi:hypothetical protein